MKWIWLIPVVALVGACGKPQLSGETQRTAHSTEEVGSQALKDKTFKVIITDPQKALSLLSKPNQDRFISNGNIGPRADVLVNDYDLICDFTSLNDATFSKTRASIRSGTTEFKVVSRTFGTSYSGGYAIESITFQLNRTEDLAINCTRLYVNAHPIRVEDVRAALRGTFEVWIDN